MKKNTIILLILAVLLCLPTLVNCEWIRVATFRSVVFVQGGQVDAWFDNNEWAHPMPYLELQTVYDLDGPHPNDGVGVNARVTHNGNYFFDWVQYDPYNLPPHLFVYIN